MRPTNSGDFPTTADAYQSSLRSAGQNAFMTKLRVDGGGLVYSTYLSGNGPGDFGYAIALDGAGDAYVTGVSSGGFPITDGAFQATSTTVVSTTSSTATTTLVRGATTTTSTLPCASARCALSALPQSPACAGQTIPPRP